MEILNLEDTKVYLLNTNQKCYTNIATKFCHSVKNIEEICNSEYDAKLVKTIIDCGHLSATEFDYYLFAIEGYSRVTEVQLVRKRLASYMISSGRNECKGKRKFNVMIPPSLKDFKTTIDVHDGNGFINIDCDYKTLMYIIEQFYNNGIDANIPEEDLRYVKPQATTFKAIIGMNAHALLDFFNVRCCENAQWEIRNLAYKMLHLCKEQSPDIFKNAGSFCKSLGYCPHNKLQCSIYKDIIPTHEQVLKLLNK